MILWDFAKTYTFEDGTTMKQHLASKGIRNYEQFEKHIQKAEDILWQDFLFMLSGEGIFYSDYGCASHGFMPMRKNNFQSPVREVLIMPGLE